MSYQLKDQDPLREGHEKLTPEELKLKFPKEPAVDDSKTNTVGDEFKEKSEDGVVMLTGEKTVETHEGQDLGGYQPTHEFECPFDMEENWLEKARNIEPAHPVRETHYLLNVSPFGPNNQYRGFRDAVMLALYLNRTIVLPPFFKHGTDPSYSKFQDFKNCENSTTKTDPFTFASFTNFITFDEFVERCAPRVDWVAYARTPITGGGYRQLINYEKLSGMKLQLLNKQDFVNFRDYSNISDHIILPQDQKYYNFYEKSQFGGQVFINMRHNSVMGAFKGANTFNEKCAIWLMPFRNFLWDNTLADPKLPPYKTKEAKLSAEMLMKTRRPVNVQNGVEEFAKNVMKKKYISMHWRYDIHDFGYHCQRTGGGSKACGYILHGGFDPQVLGKSMYVWLKSQGDYYAEDAVFYIAAPPSETQFIKDLAAVLERFKVQVFHQEHVKSFIDAKYKSTCPTEKYKGEVHDYMSQFEQELCMKGEIFLCSDSSSWSVAIQFERDVRGVSENDSSN